MVIVSAVLLTAIEAAAQNVQRQCISTTGTSAITVEEGVVVLQTVGQPYSTAAYYDSDLGHRPGFQQYSKLNLEQLSSTFRIVVNLYPNPASEAVTIESQEAIRNASLTVTDMSGKTILQEKFGELHTHTIDCAEWANGVYFIILSDDQNSRSSSKLIVSK